MKSGLEIWNLEVPECNLKYGSLLKESAPGEHFYKCLFLRHRREDREHLISSEQGQRGMRHTRREECWNFYQLRARNNGLESGNWNTGQKAAFRVVMGIEFLCSCCLRIPAALTLGLASTLPAATGAQVSTEGCFAIARWTHCISDRRYTFMKLRLGTCPVGPAETGIK